MQSTLSTVVTVELRLTLEEAKQLNTLTLGVYNSFNAHNARDSVPFTLAISKESAELCKQLFDHTVPATKL